MNEKILIIDDDVDTLKLVGLMLQKQGYQIVAANNGPQGLAQAESENPDLILLDVMMPEMDGYEVTKRLRGNPLTANTPILMFTAKTQLDDKVTGFEAGADDYLTKPTHPTELSAHVKALLARSTKGRVATAPLPAEKKALTIGVLAARGGLGVTTVAANLGEALRVATKGDVIVAELRPGMGTLAPNLGVASSTVLTELLSTNVADLTRQKVEKGLSAHPKTNLRMLFGSTQPKDASFLNAISPMETLVNRLSFLTPYLVLDLGAGLTSLNQKLVTVCNLVLVVVEPITNTIIHSKALIADLMNVGVSKWSINTVVVNRIRSEVQLSITQLEEQMGQSPLTVVTPAAELLYSAVRMKANAAAIDPTNLFAQQFAKLASAVLDFEKRQR